MWSHRWYPSIQDYSKLKAENIKLNKHFLWDTLEIDWKEVTVTFNDNRIDLPTIIVIKLQDKIKVRRLMNRKPLLLHLKLKQVHGSTWWQKHRKLCKYKSSTHLLSAFYTFSRWLVYCSPNVTPCMDFLCRLPVETVDVEVRITLMQGTHMLRRDWTCQLIKCNL